MGFQRYSLLLNRKSPKLSARKFLLLSWVLIKPSYSCQTVEGDCKILTTWNEKEMNQKPNIAADKMRDTYSFTCCLRDNPSLLIGQFHKKNASLVLRFPGFSWGIKEWSWPGMMRLSSRIQLKLIKSRVKKAPYTQKHVWNPLELKLNWEIPDRHSRDANKWDPLNTISDCGIFEWVTRFTYQNE